MALSIRSEYVQKDVFDKLNPTLKEKYMQLTFEGKDVSEYEKDETLKLFLGEIMNDYFWNKDPDGISELKTSVYRKIFYMKQRWMEAINKEMEEMDKQAKIKNPSISVDIEIWNKLEKSQGLMRCIQTFNSKSLKEYIAKIMNELNDWFTDKNSLLVDFKYINSKTKTQIEKSLSLDFQYNIANIAISDYYGDLINIYTERPNTWINIPLISDRKGFMDIETIVESETGEQLTISDYEIDENHLVRTMIDSENLKPGARGKINFPVLDPRDNEIINVILSKRDSAFHVDKTILIDIGEVVDRVYESKGSKNYNDAIARILRLPEHKISGIIVKSSSDLSDYKLFNYSLFQDSEIERDGATNKRYAKVVLTDRSFNQLIKNSVTTVYSNQIKSLSNDISKILVFPFQQERLQHCTSTLSHRGFYSYAWFRRQIRFRSKKKSINLDLVEASLKDFKEKIFLIKDYRRVADGFEIEFLPIPDYEMKDLATKKNPVMIEES